MQNRTLIDPVTVWFIFFNSLTSYFCFAFPHWGLCFKFCKCEFNSAFENTKNSLPFLPSFRFRFLSFFLSFFLPSFLPSFLSFTHLSKLKPLCEIAWRLDFRAIYCFKTSIAIVQQACTNSRRQMARSTKLCIVTSIFGSSVWNLPHVTFVAPRILKWLLDCWKMFVSLLKKDIISLLSQWFAIFGVVCVHVRHVYELTVSFPWSSQRNVCQVLLLPVVKGQRKERNEIKQRDGKWFNVRRDSMHGHWCASSIVK